MGNPGPKSQAQAPILTSFSWVWDKGLSGAVSDRKTGLKCHRSHLSSPYTGLVLVFRCLVPPAPGRGLVCSPPPSWSVSKYPRRGE